MTAFNETGRRHTENQLVSHCKDFTAAYMGVKYLASHIHKYPDTITHPTIDALVHVIEFSPFDNQKQVFFLYSEASEALVCLAEKAQNKWGADIIQRLVALLPGCRGKRLRAIGQALGKLSLEFSAPFFSWDLSLDSLEIELKEIENFVTKDRELSYAWKGRSLMILSRTQVMGVVKFATSQDNIKALSQESQWMDFLGSHTLCPDESFKVPLPIKLKKKRLFKLITPLPPGGPETIEKKICIAFVPCDGYFDYPNDKTQKWSEEQIKAIFFKNARLLGALSGRGIFHTALIPLFHNRAQQLRRNDNGAYLWEHGGRLDQWLDSCQFPNFGASGPRDFEHLVQMNNSQKLRHYIGEHLLSFTLVIGSYFRNKAPDRRGKDEHQLPLDTRDLFSPPLFIELLSGVCKAYFKGLANKSMAPEFDLCSFELVEALIQVMGKDKDMEEVLRVHDQNQMSQTYFSQFLKQRGISTPPLKGKQDIVLETGPHLGGFNQAISVPELIDALFRFSAILVSTCFLNENKLKA